MQTTDTATLSTTSRALVERIRNQWTVVQTQWIGGEKLRALLEHLGERVRSVLDLPTKKELSDLTQRLDDMERRLLSLHQQRVAPPAESRKMHEEKRADKRAKKPQ